MPKQRQDILKRAHKLMDKQEDDAILLELNEENEFKKTIVLIRLEDLTRKLQREFGVARDTALHAIADVIRERRKKRKESQL